MRNWRYIKRLVVLLLICGVTCALCGCVNRCLSIEHETVDVKVVGADFSVPLVPPTKIGDTYVPVYYPPVYRVKVLYDGKWYNIEGEDTYNQYKDRIGETVAATMEIRTFIDDTISRDIVSLGSVEATE